jgi:hypothetical protein
MKKFFIFIMLMMVMGILNAQTYPSPEFTNEVSFLKKDSGLSIVRLEKESSKMDTKSKLTGSESGYTVAGEHSPIRLHGSSGLSFVFTNNSTSGATDSKAKTDSMMRANGVDPAIMDERMGNMSDPANMITLYKVESTKGNRKIYLMKMGGALPFSSHKQTSSDKYTFSVRKIRDGYYELLIDKSLPRGEYAFTLTGMGMGNMDGGVTIYAFGLD